MGWFVYLAKRKTNFSKIPHFYDLCCWFPWRLTQRTVKPKPKLRSDPDLSKKTKDGDYYWLPRCTTVQSDQVTSNQIIFINQLSFVLVIKVLSADSRWEYLWIHYPLGSSHFHTQTSHWKAVFKRCILFIHNSKVGSLRKCCSIVATITLYSWNLVYQNIWISCTCFNGIYFLDDWM